MLSRNFSLVFQVLFHHIFVRMLEDIGHDVVCTGHYSVEFELRRVFFFHYVRFWKEKQLCRVPLKRTGRVEGRASAEVNLLTGFLAAISTRPSLVCCSGCSLELVQLLDKSTIFTQAIKSPKRFEELSLQRLIQKRSNSVFERMDFVSVLQYLTVSLGGSLSLECVQLAPELSKVGSLLFDSWSTH